MALDRIEQLLERYFEGETSIAEEKELKVYFTSSNVAQHLEQYRSVFGYFSQAKEEEFTASIPLQTKKRNRLMKLSIAATIIVMLGFGGTMYYNSIKTNTLSEYGTYDDPEVALKETQKALDLVSEHINSGVESIGYINEYNNSKNRIFKQ